MKNTKRLLTVGLLVGLLGAGSAFWFFNWQRQTDARAQLNNLLGAQAALPDLNPSPGVSIASPEAMSGFLNLPQLGFDALSGLIPASSVDVQETASAYQIKVPLAKPEDASSVQLNVSPHRIEISGQTGHFDQGSSVQSSFMQRFTTSSEVLPNQVKRQTQKQGDQLTLMITIPKKQPGQATQLPDSVSPSFHEGQSPPVGGEESLTPSPTMEDDANPRAI